MLDIWLDNFFYAYGCAARQICLDRSLDLRESVRPIFHVSHNKFFRHVDWLLDREILKPEILYLTNQYAWKICRATYEILALGWVYNKV